MIHRLTYKLDNPISLIQHITNIGISGVAHYWFLSYLLDRNQSIYIQGTTSKSVFL